GEGETAKEWIGVIGGHGDHLRQQAGAVGSRQPVIPFALSRQILSDTRPRHGYPLERGNRTCATDASSPVTIILRRCVPLPRQTGSPSVSPADSYREVRGGRCAGVQSPPNPSKPSRPVPASRPRTTAPGSATWRRA